MRVENCKLLIKEDSYSIKDRLADIFMLTSKKLPCNIELFEDKIVIERNSKRIELYYNTIQTFKKRGKSLTFEIVKDDKPYHIEIEFENYKVMNDVLKLFSNI